jgi:hypothetical protein
LKRLVPLITPEEVCLNKGVWILGEAVPTMFWLLSRRILLSREPSKFLHSQHLQFSPQKIFAWKHSQYFFRHPDFLQAHPFNRYIIQNIYLGMPSGGAIYVRSYPNIVVLNDNLALGVDHWLRGGEV